MNTQLLTAFQQRITGKVILPEHQAYEAARHVFNQSGSPAVIVRAHTTIDIVETLRLAREQKLPLSLRSGGHGLSGHATNTSGIVLDLAAFNQVTILDPQKRLVRIGTGAHWGDVARILGEHHLAISSGDTKQVGVGGLTLGGGIGWLVRTTGLALDSLHAAEVVTADGRILRVNTKEHPELFWAIRGGGGNFGVVTTFDFVATPCTAVIGGAIHYEPTEAESVLSGWVEAMRSAPEELNSTLVLFSGFGPQVPPRISILLCYAGENEAAAHAAIEPLLHLGTVQAQDIHKKPYDAMLEDATALPPGLKQVGHNGFIKELTQDVLSALAANYGRPGKPIAQIRYLGGAMARVAPQETAFVHRDSEALVIVPAFAPTTVPEEQAQQIRQAAWSPLAAFSHGAYLNFLSEASEASLAAVYPPETAARLAQIKAHYDPDNLFNQNQNSKPVEITLQ
ncbi:FAD/FMN-containing dehydrogenase [Thermosporothrix hazakensis]|jgi:FAD/FMN-containing dehydrogenase|uniref:FAD/FMN-containing dehydrogenase n=1 Tax=Thermosporothrix hazakensis TaxID=644383 RepID=A0A326U5G3_THEHA|nr:FAD-binding oxidoreductase [Thermosporothrix hazakensis]PZW25262.1 FAD/FMN-containing dehydrogenase [Thermosporothrix hazakensis]GCE50495.1 FAD-linked oxidase [Thermosporothrix hazakensis]